MDEYNIQENKKYINNKIDISKEKYQLLKEDILYSLVLNLKENEISISDLAVEFGISEFKLKKKIEEKDFFVCLEIMLYLVERGLYTEYGRLKDVNYFKPNILLKNDHIKKTNYK